MKFTGRVDLRAADNLIRKLEELEKPVTQADAKEIGNACLKEMKSLIAKGTSPVRGAGISSRFAPYKNPDKYPGKRKAHVPVNLRLTGKMLDDLDVSIEKSVSGYAPALGYSSSSEQVKERGHREGANKQPKRPTIPQGRSGETFAPSIQAVYISLLNSIVNRIARRK